MYDLAKVDEEADEHVDPVSLARGVKDILDSGHQRVPDVVEQAF